MLREDELDIFERQALTHVEHTIHTGEWLRIDIHPARQDHLAASEMEAWSH
ncbi:MAG: hypothetical protein ACXWH7_11410 [Thermoanaerobaculia bacterium]